MFQITIEKDKVNKMPVANFDRAIYLIDSMAGINAAVAALRRAPLVGFDTETRPSFKKGEFHKTALVQLATESECFLFRTNKIGLPNRLRDFLEDDHCLKVGLSIHDDFRTLSRIEPVTPGGFVELQTLAAEHQIAEMSLQKIYAILFGQKISKSQRLTNWEAPELTASQQRYAALDAWACIDIYKKLTSGEFIAEQSPYYHEVIEEKQD